MKPARNLRAMIGSSWKVHNIFLRYGNGPVIHVRAYCGKNGKAVITQAATDCQRCAKYIVPGSEGKLK